MKFSEDLHIQSCPFCGSLDFENIEDSEKGYWRIECMGPGCAVRGPIFFSEEAAIKAWNTRYPPAPAPQSTELLYSAAEIEKAILGEMYHSMPMAELAQRVLARLTAGAQKQQGEQHD